MPICKIKFFAFEKKYLENPIDSESDYEDDDGNIFIVLEDDMTEL